MTRDQRKALQVIRAHPELRILPSTNAKGARVLASSTGPSYVWVNTTILLNLYGQGLVQPVSEGSHIFELTPRD